MSGVRYPNADYPQAYDEDDMVKAGDVAVNVAGSSLTITEAGTGQGPLGDVVTGADVETRNLLPDVPEDAESE